MKHLFTKSDGKRSILNFQSAIFNSLSVRKFIFFLLLLFCFSVSFAQSGGWGINISGGIIHNHSRTARDGSRVEITHTINKDYTLPVLYNSIDGLGAEVWSYWNVKSSYEMDQRVTTLHFFSKYGIKNAANEDGSWNSFDLQVLNEPIKYNYRMLCKSNYCEKEWGMVNLFEEYYGFAEVIYYPENIEVSYKGAIGNILPFDEKTTILAPSGYHPEVYHWEFSGDFGDNWQSFPDSLQAKTGLNFSAQDIYGKELATLRMEQPHTETWVRMKYRSLEGIIYTNVIILNERFASPRMLSLTPVPNRCSDETNGKLFLQLDRSLRQGEQLEVYYNDEMQLFLDTLGTNEITITDLSPGIYTVQLAGSYNGKGTYSASPAHRATIEIQSPLFISFNAQKHNDIHCFDGSDGAFRIHAEGGVGGYNLFWKNTSDAGFQTMAFPPSERDSCLLDRLPADTYTVYVSDKNGCFRKNIDEDPATIQITLTQPLKPVEITDMLLINPFGYNREDGSIDLTVEGGTPDENSMYQVMWKKETDFVIIPGKVNNNLGADEIFHTMLSGVGEGTYMVEITDAGYGKTDVSNNWGCIARDTFTLVEPPKLIASIIETHDISCYNGEDGQLSADVTGGVPMEGKYPYYFQWERLEGESYVKVNAINNDTISDLYAAHYRLIVTDKYQNRDTTVLFQLQQPEELKLFPTHTQIKCNGDNSGKVYVTATGGTFPYDYQWNTGAISDTISDLYVGRYLVRVTDAKACTREMIADVNAPEQISLHASVTHPTCFQSRDGSIDLQISGGHPEYTQIWNTGDTTQNLTRIGAGSYHVEVRDKNNCVAFLEFQLEEPEPLTLELGPDRTLCKQQSLHLKPAVKDSLTKFYWQADNGFYSEAEEVVLTESGIYSLCITDSKFCQASDSIRIIAKMQEISSEFIVATEIFRNDTVILVNVSLPEPDSTSWMIEDPSIEIVEIDTYYAKIIFRKNGNFLVGHRSFRSDCFEDTYKSMAVMEPEDFVEWEDFNQALIKQFKVYPNPNQGIFSVDVELERVSAIRLRMIHLATGKVVHDLKQNGENFYQIPYHLSLAPGVYLLLLETSSGKQTMKIVVL